MDNDRLSTDTNLHIHALDNEKKKKGKRKRKIKQQELNLGEEGKPKLNSSLNSCLCSGGEQHEKSAANRPNYFSILPMVEVLYVSGWVDFISKNND